MRFQFRSPSRNLRATDAAAKAQKFVMAGLDLAARGNCTTQATFLAERRAADTLTLRH
jgi:hypothetical protein